MYSLAERRCGVLVMMVHLRLRRSSAWSSSWDESATFLLHSPVLLVNDWVGISFSAASVCAGAALLLSRSGCGQRTLDKMLQRPLF